MAYTTEAIARMAGARVQWEERQGRLLLSVACYPFKVPAAREMMQHGVSRRLADLQHALGRVFEVLPPDADAPSRAQISDATAFLQAFVINTFGVVDNLAWVWALEADVRKDDGPVPAKEVGFMPRQRLMRASVSDRTRAYLASADDWCRYLEGYRHALAHRVPLYIPPRTVDGAGEAEFRRLEAAALVEGPGSEAWSRMLGAHSTLGVFLPVMMHSYSEGAPPMWFHERIISDLGRVIEIGEHIARDLEELRG